MLDFREFVVFPAWARDFCCFLCPEQQGAYSLSIGTSLSIKATGDEVDQSLALSTESTMVQVIPAFKNMPAWRAQMCLVFFDTQYGIIQNFPTRVLKS